MECLAIYEIPDCPTRLCPGPARKSTFVSASVRISVFDFTAIKHLYLGLPVLDCTLHTPASTCGPTAQPPPPPSPPAFQCRLIHNVRARRRLMPYWRRGHLAPNAVGGARRSDSTHDQSEAYDKPRTALYRVDFLSSSTKFPNTWYLLGTDSARSQPYAGIIPSALPSTATHCKHTVTLKSQTDRAIVTDIITASPICSVPVTTSRQPTSCIYILSPPTILGALTIGALGLMGPIGNRNDDLSCDRAEIFVFACIAANHQLVSSMSSPLQEL